MTAVDAGTPLAEPTPSPATPAAAAVSEPDVSPVLRGCPFLMSEEGGWRLATPSAPPATQVAVVVVTPAPPALTLPPTGSVEPTTAPTVAPTTAPPSLPPTPTATPRPTFRTYVVRSGDTLSGIASRYHTTVSTLAALNHISDPSKLRVGQVLLIPN